MIVFCSEMFPPTIYMHCYSRGSQDFQQLSEKLVFSSFFPEHLDTDERTVITVMWKPNFNFGVYNLLEVTDYGHVCAEKPCQNPL